MKECMRGKEKEQTAQRYDSSWNGEASNSVEDRAVPSEDGGGEDFTFGTAGGAWGYSLRIIGRRNSCNLSLSETGSWSN